MQPNSANFLSIQNTDFNSSHRYDIISTKKAIWEARGDASPLKAGSWESSQNPKMRLNIVDTFTSTIFLLRCKLSTHVSSFLFHHSPYQRKGKQVCKTQHLVLLETDILFTPPLLILQHTLGLGLSDWRPTKVCHRGLNLEACLNISHK